MRILELEFTFFMGFLDSRRLNLVVEDHPWKLQPGARTSSRAISNSGTCLTY